MSISDIYIIFTFKNAFYVNFFGTYIKTSLIRHLCNSFHCVNQHLFSYPLDNLLCFLHGVIRYPVYSDTTFLSQGLDMSYCRFCFISTMRGLVLDLVRLREFRATNTKMTPNFVHSSDKKINTVNIDT